MEVTLNPDLFSQHSDKFFLKIRKLHKCVPISPIYYERRLIRFNIDKVKQTNKIIREKQSPNLLRKATTRRLHICLFILI